jgi:hypothetical protein
MTMTNLMRRKSACSHSLLPATATPARYHTSPSLGNHIRTYIRCSYKTVDFATAASQNDVCKAQGKGHKMI